MLSKRFCSLFSSLRNNIKNSNFLSTLASENSVNHSEEDTTKWTEKLKISFPEETTRIPVFRIMDKLGKVLENADIPKLDGKLLVSMYKCMTQLNVMDKILYESQRQGRISFYMTHTGEEACQVGSAAALEAEDLIYAQYREAGVLMWRGFSLDSFMNQCYGNANDVGKGKQMPIHYGSKECNFVTISSPLSTQMPQAVGSAYAYKRAKNGRCVAVYFGEGAASEGDAHAAFNFASVLDAPVLFICRNNGYAISTPIEEQYRGDGIAGRGLSYGIPVLRVDGNDILAVYHGVVAARHLIRETLRPVIVEAMTYRIGHHSTSDDSSAYRTPNELSYWQQFNPILRFKEYLKAEKLWDESMEEEWIAEAKQKVMNAFNAAEKIKKPDWREMFTDINWAMPANLMKQREYLSDHLKEYKHHYPISDFNNS